MLVRAGSVGIASLMALASAVIAPRSAFAQSPSAPASVGEFEFRGTADGVVTFAAPDGSLANLAIGCDPTTSLSDRQALYLACAGGIVVRIVRAEGAARYVARRDRVESEIVRFYRDGEHVLVEYRGSRVVDASVPTITIGASDGDSSERCDDNSRTADARDDDSEVLAVNPGEVVVDLGADDGVFVGQRILLEPPEDEPRTGPGREPVIGRVTRIEPHRARVRITVNERPRVHWRASVTERQPAVGLATPRRASGMFTVGGTFGVGIAADPVGAILTGTLFASYRFDVPVFVEAGLAQGGIGFGFRSGPFGTSNSILGGAAIARAQGGLDHRWISLGVGLGFTTHVPDNRHSATSGLAITQSARFGALDGFHIAVENVIAVLDCGVAWAAFQGSLRIPLVSTTWLEVHAGGGTAGYFGADLGLRRTIRGNGERGSMFMTLAIGGISYFGGLYTATGPIATAGLEARL